MHGFCNLADISEFVNLKTEYRINFCLSKEQISSPRAISIKALKK